MLSSPAFRLARSYLIAPGSHQRLVDEAIVAGADAVVLDLEDGVALAHKPAARVIVAGALAAAAGRRPRPLLLVRVNAVASGLWRDDLDAVVGPGLDAVRVARVESAHALDQVHALVSALERERGLAEGHIGVVATIESAAGALEVPAIARAPRVRALAFGAADFLRDIGAGPDAGDEETAAVRAQLVLASRAAGLLPPIAPVFPRLDRPDLLKASTVAARRQGFFGRSVFHPSQLALVHEVFTPDPGEVASARALVAAFDSRAHDDASAAVCLDDGVLVDPGRVARARWTIALAEDLAARTA